MMSGRRRREEAPEEPAAAPPAVDCAACADMNPNPWLDIALDDYEAHMALPAVAQDRLLAGLFGAALDRAAPRSVAVIGVAGGNGLAEAERRSIGRVVGIDLNPAYLDAVRRRWQGRFAQLELVAGDVQTEVFDLAPVDLVFAGLVLEYTRIDAALPRLAGLLRPDGSGGRLATVLQLPAPGLPEVTPSPYTALQRLAPIFRPVAPDALLEAAERCGLAELERQVVTTAAGKRFCAQTFGRPPAAGGRPC